MVPPPEQAVPSFATFALDAILHIVRFPLKALLLAMIVRLFSHNEADVHRRTVIKTTAFVLVLTFLINTSPSGVLGIYPFCLIVLVTTLLVKKVFWVDIEKALLASIVFVFLSVSLTDYSNRGMDKLIPDRPTIGGVLADLMDARVREKTGDATLPPSHRFMPALLRMAAGPEEEGGIIHDLMSPFRTLQKAKTQIADIDQKARASASVVNMLSGAGTNVGDRASEMQALEQSLAASAQGAPPPPAGTTAPAAPSPAGGFAGTQATHAQAPPPTPPPAAPAPMPADTGVSGDTFAESVAKGIMNLYAKLTGKQVPEAPPVTTRAPRAVPPPAPPQAAPTPPPPAAPVEEPPAAQPEPPQARQDDAAAMEPPAEAPPPAPPVTGHPDAPAPHTPAAAAPATNAPATSPSITNSVVVPHAEHAQYVPTPEGMKISSVVSRTDGSGFLTCNGHIVGVGGVATVPVDGIPTQFKLEAIEGTTPHWSLVPKDEAAEVIPFGGP